MKKLIAMLAGVALIACSAQASLLLRYAFTGESSAADQVADNITASTFSATDADGDPATINFVEASNFDTTDLDAGTISNPSGGVAGWVRADTFASAQGDEETQGYLGFTITPAAGFRVSLTGLEMAYRMGANAPTSLAVGIGDAAPANWDLIESGIPGNSARAGETPLDFEGADDEAVEVRIYGWGGDSPGAGQFRFDDVQVFGEVIPEPGTMALLMMGFAGLVAFVRRRQL